MGRTVLAIAAAALLVSLHATALRYLDGFHATGPVMRIDYVLPGPILRMTALEFDGLAADVMFLKATTFYGERVYKRMRLAAPEWDRLIEALTAATDLDPVFLDPYHFGEMVLTWDAGRVADANRLLEKAQQYRTVDWVIPYYLGFNHFYFLHDKSKGSEYLMQASRLPESHKFLGLLASRLSTEAGRAEAAVVFLQELAAATPDPQLRRQLEQRLGAIKAVAVIERAVGIYRERYGGPPQRLEQLTEARILKALPKDPYGGQFFLDQEGRVQTTSRLVSRVGPGASDRGPDR